MTCKKISTLLLVIVIALIMSIALVACTEGDEKEIVGAVFEDLTVVYDGDPHTITVGGTLPKGVKITYTNNTATEVGKYTAIATLYGKGYKTVTLVAQLTILSPDVDITGITFDDLKVIYDGEPHSITVSGELPNGVSVSYQNNTATEVGVYEACATLTGKGYNQLVLTAKLTIERGYADIADVTFADKTVDFDGNIKSIVIDGTLPQGVSVTYKNNFATDAGEYIATATFSQANRIDVVLTATLTITPVSHVVVNTSEELIAALNNGEKLILLDSDIVLKNGDVAAITKDTHLNGKGHTLSAENYADNYRVINISGKECKNVTISNLNVVAEKWVSWLRGINLYETNGLTLNISNVNVKLCDYYAFNLLGTNVDLTVNMQYSTFSAWAAVYNRASGLTFNAKNCLFEGINTHISPNSTSNYFTTFIVSEYVLLNDDEFTAVNLSANNRFALTNCSIISKIVPDESGDLIDTKQKLIDIRSPYNNSIELVNCTLSPVYYEDIIYSAYDSKYIPDEHRDDPDYVVDTNKIIIDGKDVTEDERYVQKYLDS